MISEDSFPTTQWTIVALAADVDEGAKRRALEALCRIYRGPVLGFMKRRAPSPEDAEDWTQGFFAQLAESSSLDAAKRDLGRFRCFLQAAAGHYAGNRQRERMTLKRGGHLRFVGLDGLDDAARAGASCDDAAVFDRDWALAVTNRALERLRLEFSPAGQAESFEVLKEALWQRTGEELYRQWGASLGLGSAAVKMRVHRLRKAFRALLREEVRRTVADGSEVEDELRYLWAVIAGVLSGELPPGGAESSFAM